MTRLRVNHCEKCVSKPKTKLPFTTDDKPTPFTQN